MSNKPTSSLRTLLTLLKPAGARTDAFLTHLHHTLSTSSGIDSLLTTLYFTAFLTHAQLRNLLTKQFERLATALASNAPKTMLPNEIMLAQLEPPRTRLYELCTSTKALTDLLQDSWICFRLWGLLGIYHAARDNYLKPPGDAPLKLLVWMRVSAGAIFQFLENAAFLAGKGVLRGSRWEEREGKWNVWSRRFWFAQVVVEGLRLLRVRQLRFREEFGAKEADGEGEKEVKIQSVELRRRWQRDVWVNAGWVAVTLHGSFEDEEKSIVGEVGAGLGGLVAGLVGLLKAWEEAGDA
ncbi:hypothetical protein B0A50_03739 [Salinomyces thailandicus]|uniref:Peroxin 11C n=1 Tax=Salinomyces thailandicus TaxID=706561 RepID=A0A4V5N4U6_9PEZI|nr:hypothetical protein B0A50_03739 [Salinomyces thailandica]